MNKVLIGHCLEVLQQLPTGSVHATITSPPYFGLRDYGLEPVYWPSVTFAPMAGLPPLIIPEQVCCLGLEGDIWSYVGHLVAVFREVKRVVRGDGVLFLNLGDSYAGSGRGPTGHNGIGNQSQRQGFDTPKIFIQEGLKPKDLMGIPWRVAYALQADGWYLRSDIPWVKRNGMPGSQQDRPTTSKEYWFLLSKSERYYFDLEAIKMPLAESSHGRAERKQKLIDRTGTGTLGKQIEEGVNQEHAYAGLALARNGKTGYNESGRARRDSDWFFDSLRAILEDNAQILLTDEEGELLALTANPAGYSAAHFATFPPKLIEPMILASTSQEGVCGECGNPWRRVVEKESKPKGRSSNEVYTGQAYGNNPQSEVWGPNKNLGGNPLPVVTTGWQPSCTHNAPIVPAVILDPFFGSGTTGEVAIKHRRNCIGIEANPAYGEGLAGDRLDGVQIVMGLEP